MHAQLAVADAHLTNQRQAAGSLRLFIIRVDESPVTDAIATTLDEHLGMLERQIRDLHPATQNASVAMRTSTRPSSTMRGVSAHAALPNSMPSARTRVVAAQIDIEVALDYKAASRCRSHSPLDRPFGTKFQSHTAIRIATASPKAPSTHAQRGARAIRELLNVSAAITR
jgi:hypothetical protein